MVAWLVGLSGWNVINRQRLSGDGVLGASGRGGLLATMARRAPLTQDNTPLVRRASHCFSASIDLSVPSSD
jgi:hypothetical protein